MAMTRHSGLMGILGFHRNDNRREKRHLYVYPRSDGKWAWKLVASNGQVIANDGGQGYSNEVDAIDIGTSVTGIQAQRLSAQAAANIFGVEY